MNAQPAVRTRREAKALWPYACAMALSLFVVEVFLLWPGLKAPMVYDSRHFIADKVERFSLQGLSGAIGVLPGRPLAMASFYLNYSFGGMDPIPFRLVNIALLVCCGVVVFVLLNVLAWVADPPSEGEERLFKILAALLTLAYVVHPLQIYVALYIYQRMALISSLCLLSSLALYMGTRSGWLTSRYLGYSAAFVLYQLGMFSKPNIFTLPVMLVLAEIAFFRPHVRELLARSALFLVATLPYFVIMKLFVEGPHGDEAHEKWFLELISLYYQEAGLSFKELVLTQCRVFFSYLVSVFLPMPSTVVLTQAQVISRSPVDPPTTLAALSAMVALIGGGVWLLGKRPLTGFGIAFLILAILPESLLVPQYLYVGYRPILPMVGILLILADLVCARCRKAADRTVERDVHKIVTLAFLPVIVFLATETRLKAYSWANQALFWEQELETFPPYGPHVEKKVYLDAFLNLGDAYVRSLQWAHATRVYEKAIEIEPNLALLHNNFGLALCEMGQTEAAVKRLTKAIVLDPTMADAHNNLGLALLRSGDMKAAMDCFAKAIETRPGFATAHSNLGAALLQQGMHSKAIPVLEQALRMEPSSAEAHHNLGLAYYRLGALSKAIDHFQKALVNDPELPGVRDHLQKAIVAQRKGSP